MPQIKAGDKAPLFTAETFNGRHVADHIPFELVKNFLKIPAVKNPYEKKLAKN